MTVVRNTVTNPTGGTLPPVKVTIQLVVSADGTAEGWLAGTQHGILAPSIVQTAVDTGTWTADLPPNAGIDPAGTFYRITEEVNGRLTTYTIVVPASGGPYWVHDLLQSPTPPGPFDPTYAPLADLDAHLADTTNVHGIADTSLLETQAGAQAKASAALTSAEMYSDAGDAAHVAASDPHSQYALARAYTSLPRGWDTIWAAAKTGSASTPAGILALGDSETIGQNASNWLTASWFGLLRAALLARSYTLCGDSYTPSESVAAHSGYQGTPPFTWSATNRSGFGNDGYNQVAYYTGAATNMGSAVSPRNDITDVDVVFFAPFNLVGNTLSFDVDGATGSTVATAVGFAGANLAQSVSAGKITCTVTLPAQSQNPMRVRITGLTAGQRTVNFTAQSASNVSLILAVVFYKSRTAGLWFARHAVSGRRMYEWANSSAQPTDRIAWLRGSYSGGSTGFGPPTGPSLAIIAIGINDAVQLSLGPQGFERGLWRMVEALETSSRIIVALNVPDGVTSDVTSTFNNPESYRSLVRMMRSVADASQSAFASVQQKWGNRGVALGFQTALEPHPNDAGYADIASLLGSIV